MGQGIVTKERRRHSLKACRHHWIIETPNGATSRGMCKRCGKTRRFPNAPDEMLWDSTSTVMGRWARREEVQETLTAWAR